MHRHTFNAYLQRCHAKWISNGDWLLLIIRVYSALFRLPKLFWVRILALSRLIRPATLLGIFLTVTKCNIIDEVGSKLDTVPKRETKRIKTMLCLDELIGSETGTMLYKLRWQGQTGSYLFYSPLSLSNPFLWLLFLQLGALSNRPRPFSCALFVIPRTTKANQFALSAGFQLTSAEMFICLFSCSTPSNGSPVLLLSSVVSFSLVRSLQRSVFCFAALCKKNPSLRKGLSHEPFACRVDRMAYSFCS